MNLRDERGDLRSLQISVLLIFVLGAGIGAAIHFAPARPPGGGAPMPRWEGGLLAAAAIAGFWGLVLGAIFLKSRWDDRRTGDH